MLAVHARMAQRSTARHITESLTSWLCHTGQCLRSHASPPSLLLPPLQVGQTCCCRYQCQQRTALTVVMVPLENKVGSDLGVK